MRKHQSADEPDAKTESPRTGTAVVSGVFEPAGNNAGHLRSPEDGYRARPGDVRVSAELCRTLALRGGETVVGALRDNPGNNRRSGTPELGAVTAVSGNCVDDYLVLTPFEKHTAIDPEEQVRFETAGGPTSMRMVDLLTPIGFGQRGLIVAPPRTGKTILLEQMADGVATNHPDAHLIVLLIDERPEEVTHMRRVVRGEVVASSNDESLASHVRIARLIIERAKRLVESGRNVVIFLDSLTRLGRTFNAFTKGSGRIMSGGLDIGALTEPKAIFGAARNVENGGSLTIIASALIETGSRMDEVIFNEFKGTGNMEIMLSRDMANRRIWPAMDLDRSGTRKEELLLTPEALEVSYQIRRSFVGRDPSRTMEAVLEAMEKHPDNAKFIANFSPRRLR